MPFYYKGNPISGGAQSAEEVTWDDILDKPEIALKSDITSVYRYKGSVSSYSDLPAEYNDVGDVWNVEDTGMNYAWDGEQWDALGEILQIDSITSSELDEVLV